MLKLSKSNIAVKQEQEKILNSLRIDNKNHRELINIGRIFLEWKDNLQTYLFESYYAIDHLIGCIAKKKKCHKKIVRNVLPNEIEDFIFKNIPSIKQIRKRINFCVMVCKENNISILTGPKAKEIISNEVEKEKISETRILNGQGVFPGIVKGQVKVIQDASEMDKMIKGSVLVSSKTNPNMIPAMVKSSAIVTDYGGLTCHAAIISQEMKIPAVIGTKIATRILKDNMLVKVDAHKGIVEILNEKKGG
jgi:phosphohistidine swiveling domain-containing protein